MGSMTLPAATRTVRTLDERQSYNITAEVLYEVEMIGEQLLRGGELEKYALRTFGNRLRELCTVAHLAIDNANEEHSSWADLLARLTGVPTDEDASH